MKVRQIGAVAAASVLALALAACGDSAKDSGSGGGGGGGSFKIGIKFDQPGLGLKQGSDYKGLDVDVAKYVAKELGHSENDIQWVQAPSAQRETLISTGQVNMVVATYSITDARKEKVNFAGSVCAGGATRRPLIEDQPTGHDPSRMGTEGTPLPRDNQCPPHAGTQ